LKKTYFTLNEDFEKIIKNSLSGKDIISINPISTGWTNMVFEVATTEGDFFFRFPRNDFWKRAIEKDAKFSQFISDKTDFNTVYLHLLYDKDRPFSIHKKISGQTLADKMDDLTPEELNSISKEISRFMVQLHSIAVNEMDSWPELCNFLDELVVSFFNSEDKEFWNRDTFCDENQICLVHGDLNSSNILLDENNHVTAIIDFGFAGFGDKYSDIARVLSRSYKYDDYKSDIINNYENFSKSSLDKNVLDNKIITWKKIDNGYINYMKSNKNSNVS